MARELKSTEIPKVSVAARSDVGNVREHNEDAFVCLPRRGRFAVIDGMGGQAAGEVASGLARKHLAGTSPLRAAILAANQEIRERGEQDANEKGMGCVLTAVNAYEAELELAHVGDTRLYLSTARGCLQVTRDHTLRAEVQEAKGLSDADADKVRRGNQVTRDVGGREDLPDLIERHVVDWAPGDLLLMCSDGLHDLVKGPELSQLLDAARKDRADVNDLVEHLVGLALERGGHDNVTVIAVRHEGKARLVSRENLLRSTIAILAAAGGYAAATLFGGAPELTDSDPSAQVALYPVAEVVADADGTIRLFEAGFDFPELLERSGDFVATGPWAAGGETIATSTEAEIQVTLSGAEVALAPEVTRWRVLLGESASLTLRNFVVDAPNVRLDVVPFNEHSRLVLEGGFWNVAAIEIEGSPVHVGHPAVQLDGARGVQLAEAPPTPPLEGEVEDDAGASESASEGASSPGEEVP